MRCWVAAILIVLPTAQGCAPLMQSLRKPGGPLPGPALSAGVWPWLVVVILLMVAAFVGGMGVALLVRRRCLTRARGLRSARAAPEELEKLQIALDIIEGVMAAMRDPEDKGPENTGG